MHDTPSTTARAQKRMHKRVQGGTIVSFTIVRQPPIGFGIEPRTIGLLRLDDGSTVVGCLTIPETCTLAIGQRVRPRMRLDRITSDGLRIYDIAYEVLAAKPVRKRAERVFPGYIVAFTGPSGVGKTTVSKVLATVLAEYAEKAPIITTRKRKKGDDGEYQYVTTTTFMKLQKEGKIIAATEIPSSSESRWYGYRAEDIETIWSKGRVPVVVTEQHLLEGLANHFGRRSILSFGLLPPGRSKRAMLSQLLHRLRGRGRDTEEQMADRMKNAERDLAFFDERKELFDHILINDDLQTVIETLKGHVLQPEEATS